MVPRRPEIGPKGLADCAVVPVNPGDELAGMQQVLQCRSTLVIDSIADAP